MRNSAAAAAAAVAAAAAAAEAAAVAAAAAAPNVVVALSRRVFQHRPRTSCFYVAIGINENPISCLATSKTRKLERSEAHR